MRSKGSKTNLFHWGAKNSGAFYVYSGKMTGAVKQEKQNMSQTEIYPACRRCRSAVPRVPREIPQDYLTGVGRNYRTGICPVDFGVFKEFILIEITF